MTTTNHTTLDSALDKHINPIDFQSEFSGIPTEAQRVLLAAFEEDMDEETEAGIYECIDYSLAPEDYRLLNRGLLSPIGTEAHTKASQDLRAAYEHEAGLVIYEYMKEWADSHTEAKRDDLRYAA